MKIFYYIRRFWEIPGVEKQLFCKFLLIFLIVNLLVHILPLRHYIFLFEIKPKYYTSKERFAKAIHITKKTLNRIISILPLRYSCLTKSIVFKLALNHLGVQSKLSIGLTKDQNAHLLAHAFITLEDKIIYLKSRNKYNLILEVQ